MENQELFVVDNSLQFQAVLRSSFEKSTSENQSIATFMQKSLFEVIEKTKNGSLIFEIIAQQLPKVSFRKKVMKQN